MHYCFASPKGWTKSGIMTTDTSDLLNPRLHIHSNLAHSLELSWMRMSARLYRRSSTRTRGNAWMCGVKKMRSVLYSMYIA